MTENKTTLYNRRKWSFANVFYLIRYLIQVDHYRYCIDGSQTKFRDKKVTKVTGK